MNEEINDLRCRVAILTNRIMKKMKCPKPVIFDEKEISRITLRDVNRAKKSAFDIEKYELAAIRIFRLWPDNIPITKQKVKEILRNKNRKQERVMARYCCVWLLRKNKYSFSACGEMYNIDHSTAIFACKKIDNILSIKGDLYELVVKLLLIK